MKTKFDIKQFPMKIQFCQIDLIDTITTSKSGICEAKLNYLVDRIFFSNEACKLY